MIAIGVRESLREQVQALMTVYDHFTDVVAKIKTGNGVGDHELLIDSVSVDQTKLYVFVLDNPDYEITYIIDEISQNFTAFAQAHHIQLIQSQKLLSHLDQQDSNEAQTPILAFWGVHPRLGTTTIALSVGQTMAEQGKSVGVLGLNAYDPGHWMIQNPEHHLEDLASFLRHNQLDRSTLLSSMEIVSGVKYLPGLRNDMHALKIGTEQVQHLIHVASASFDVLILDLGSILNTALALEGMSQSTHRFVIANDLISTQQRFFDRFDYVLKPLGIAQDELMLVGNQLHGTNKLNGFAKTVGLLPIAGIPLFPSIDMYAEGRNEPLKLFFAEKPFKKAVEAITLTVLEPSAEPANQLRITHTEVKGVDQGVAAGL